MRVLLQRVRQARVSVDGQATGAIGPGLVALVGVHRDDGDDDARFCADKTAHLRIFPDGAGCFDRGLVETGGELLAVSQFTLYADCRRGRRPSFTAAAGPEVAEALYETFIARLEQEHGVRVARGVFGAHMVVELANDGPVTVFVESPVHAGA